MEQIIKNTDPVDLQTNDSPVQPEQGLFSKKTLHQLIKYFITGVLSFGTEVSLLYFFTEVCHLWYILSNSLALLIVFIISFTLNRCWAFKSNQPFLKQFITSGLLFGLNLVVGNGVMFFFTEVVHLYYLFSKVIATGLSVSWNFFLYKYYVYK
ncbi:MAG TPA: GtrA family protein [Bacillota bacterium]|nr:GtrA family protein [Bacillota bacterium]